MKLAGKVVVITGAASGLGKALAQEFSSHQAQIVAADVNKLGLASLQNELPDITTIVTDVTKPSELENLLRDAIKINGQVDIWVNNAGIYGPEAPLLKQKPADVAHVFAVNTLGLINGSIIAANYMEKLTGGWIVNIMSSTALGHFFDKGIYVASKFGARGFTLSLEKELMSTKLLGVYPDGIKTELFGQAVPKDYHKFLEPSDIAKTVVTAIVNEDTNDLVLKR